MQALERPPPGGLPDVQDADLGIGSLAALDALPNQRAIFIRLQHAGNLVDEHDRQHGCVAESIHVARVDAEEGDVDGEGEGAGDGVGDHDEEEGDREGELQRDAADEDEEAPPGTAGAGAVVLDRVVQVHEDEGPGDQGEDGTGFEAEVRGPGLGDVLGHFCGRLLFDVGPGAGDVHEEVLGGKVSRIGGLRFETEGRKLTSQAKR